MALFQSQPKNGIDSPIPPPSQTDPQTFQRRSAAKFCCCKFGVGGSGLLGFSLEDAAPKRWERLKHKHICTKAMAAAEGQRIVIVGHGTCTLHIVQAIRTGTFPRFMLEARSISAKHFQLNNKISQCCSQHLPAERGQLPHCGVLLACEARTAPNNFLANIVFLGCSFCSNPEPFNISSKFHSCLSGIWPPLARNSANCTWNFF